MVEESREAAAESIRQVIEDAGGALRFDRFMAGALYGAHGFYRTEGRAGRRGDFITSPEVGPLFGAVLARALDTWWEELGQLASFTVIDAGAGPGTLARSIMSARPRCIDALHYVAVEVSESQRRMHPPSIESRATMPTETTQGVILANELLDNLPFRLFVFDGGWREAFVGLDGDRFVEWLQVPPTIPPSLPNSAMHGSRAAIHDEACAWVADALGRLTAGRLVAFDYYTTTDAMVSRPWRQWLRTYADHARGAHYLSMVGKQDITVEVALDQLPRPSLVESQADFLRRHGISELVGEGRQAWLSATSAPDVRTMTMRSRISESEALLDMTGLGNFSVAQWIR